MRRISIKSLPTPRIIAPPPAGSRTASTARPLDGVDDRGRPQRGDDRRQLLYVGNLNIDHDLEEIRGAIGDLKITDVAALFADRRRQAAAIARLVADRAVD